MAKLKLWVRNLFIILATVICLAGVAVGIYFICRPTDDDPDDNLTPAQREYVDAMNRTEQPDIDISHYDGLVLEDGTSVEAGDIIHSFGNYVVVENKTSGLPEFFAITTNGAQGSSSASSSPTSSPVPSDASSANNVILKKVDIKSDYSHIYKKNDEYATFGDYAIVTDNGAQPTMWVISLKTGETVLENSQINQYYQVGTGETLNSSNIGSYSVSIEKTMGNFLMVSRQDIVADASATNAKIQCTKTIYPLDNVEAKLEFVDSTEALLSCELMGNYLYVLTTKNTYVYSAQLSQTGAWQNILTLANSFVSASQEDSHVQIDNLGYFKDVVYYRIQVLDNTKLLIEKRETKSDWQANEYGKVEGYSAVAYISDYFSNHKVGFSYLVYDVANQTYVENIPEFYGKVDVLESFVDGYFVLNTNYENGAGELAGASACIYNENFDLILRYDADLYGTIIAFDGDHFVTTGTAYSTILSVSGYDRFYHAGYNIHSINSYENFVVLQNFNYYSLYHTAEDYIYSRSFLFMSQIMNGKVLAYREVDGYYLITLSDHKIEVSPIYNFDTTKTNGEYGINLYFASVGFYFTCTNSVYTYVGLDGTTYKNIQTYSYKIIDDKVYLSLTFVGGEHKLIISKMLGTMPNLSDETIENTYLNNFSQPETQLQELSGNVGGGQITIVGGPDGTDGGNSGNGDNTSTDGEDGENANTKVDRPTTGDRDNGQRGFSVEGSCDNDYPVFDIDGDWANNSTIVTGNYGYGVSVNTFNSVPSAYSNKAGEKNNLTNVINLDKLHYYGGSGDYKIPGDENCVVVIEGPYFIVIAVMCRWKEANYFADGTAYYGYVSGYAIGIPSEYTGLVDVNVSTLKLDTYTDGIQSNGQYDYLVRNGTQMCNYANNLQIDDTSYVWATYISNKGGGAAGTTYDSKGNYGVMRLSLRVSVGARSLSWPIYRDNSYIGKLVVCSGDVATYGFIASDDELNFYKNKYSEKNKYSKTTFYLYSPRPDLSYFLDIVEFGYYNEGIVSYLQNSTGQILTRLFIDKNGKYCSDGLSYIRNNSFDKCIISKQAISMNVQYHYLEENSDTTITNKNIGNATYGVQFTPTLGIVDYDAAAGDNQVNAPKGYNFLTWAVGYGDNSVVNKSSYKLVDGMAAYSAIKNAKDVKLASKYNTDSGRIAYDTGILNVSGLPIYSKDYEDYPIISGAVVSFSYLPYRSNAEYIMVNSKLYMSNSDAIQLDGSTMHLTAVYTAKRYKFTGSYIGYQGEFDYGDTITIAKQDPWQSGNTYSDIVLWYSDNDFINLSTSSTSFEVRVDDNIIYYLEKKGSFYKYDIDSNSSNTVRFYVKLRPVDYETTIDGNVDSHVYENSTAEEEFLHESQIKIPSFTVTGKQYNSSYTMDKTAKEATYTFGSGLDNGYKFISGETYKITIPNMSRSFKVHVKLDDGTVGVYHYYWNYTGEEDSSSYVDMSDGTLTITTDAIGGRKNSTVTLTVNIETAFYDGTLTSTSTDSTDEAPEIIDIGHISVSDKINSGYHGTTGFDIEGTNKHYYFGTGTTLLLTTGLSDANAQIYGTNYSVNNSYLSGLEVTHNDKTYKYDAKTSYYNSVLHDDLISSITWKIAQNPDGYGYSKLYNGSGWLNLEAGDNLIIHQNYVEKFYGLLYGKYNGEGNINKVFSVSGNVYYYVLPITLENVANSADTETAYLVILSNVNNGENSDGVRACFLYNVAEKESDGASQSGEIEQETYQFNILHTKMNSTLTLDSTLNGTLQTSSDKRYLLLNDKSGQAVVKTDDSKQYLTIFDRKVYVVTYGDDKRLQVDRTSTASADYEYLFGTNGILKNNIDSDGYLFVYVNKGNGDYSSTSTGIYWNSADSWFYKNANIETWENESGKNNIYNFAGTKPSYRFVFDVVASKGQIAKTITIYYNGITYTVSLAGMTIDSNEDVMTPNYIFTKKYYQSSTSEWITETFIPSKTNNKIKVEPFLLNMELNAINLSGSTLVAKIDLAMISAGAHISVDFVDYSVVVAGGGGIGNFGYKLDNEDDKTINIIDSTGNNTITKIKFENTLTWYDNDQDVNNYADANLFVSRVGNGYLAQGETDNTRIYFMVLGKNATKNAIVNSTFTEKAIYTVSINADPNNQNKTTYNTAQWTGFDDNTTATEMKIGDASGANWIASFTIGTKTFNSSITSDIEFGDVDGNASNVIEETLKDNLINDGQALDSDDNLLYETGKGQVASGGTTFNANMGNNFADLLDWGYTTSTDDARKVKYGATADLRGNKIVYTIATQYGYEWTGATLVIKVGINSNKTNLAVTVGGIANTNYSVILSGSEESYYLQITLENLTSANGGDIVVSYGYDETMKIGSIEWGGTDSLPTLTLTLERASIDSINLDLHYNAKEFVVTYDTSSDFGTSPVGENDYADTTTSNKTRTFTYNLIQDLDKGWGNALVYKRIGYDQLGWAYGAFYKNEYGKTENTTNSTLSAEKYKLQLYSITGGAGVRDVRYASEIKDWYTSLGEDYADVFGHDDKITMYTIWNAKTYSLILDYNDNESEDNGSTTSTKYTTSWVFDMPISSADIAGENVSFANANFTTQNTLTNAISRVYRLGYTFNGWYYKDGNFNGTDGWTHTETSYKNGTATYNGLVYSAHNDNVLTTDDNSFNLALTSTSTFDALGYEDTDNKPSQVFGYSVYQAIYGAGIWSETPGETASKFNLYASWTANTYGFIYDLNGDISVGGHNENGYKSVNYNGTISANIDAGVGSSFATLAFGDSGVVNVKFDSNLDEILSAYAYRKGYKFTGWYFARTGGDLAEETLLDQELLLKLLNGTNELELAQVKNKIATTYSAVDLVETLGTTGVTNSVDGNKDLSSLSGNAILLHAQWESLPYLVNIDLNNWNISDYGKNDSEYMAGNSQYTANNTTNVQLEIYFDTQFKDLRLKIGDTWIEKTGGTTSITRNGKEYTISGDTAYKVLVQILTAYGYTLGNGTYDFAIYGNGKGETCTVNINKDTKFGISLYDQLVYFADEKTKNADGVNNSNCTGGINDGGLSTRGAKLGAIDYSGQENKGDWHDYSAEDMNTSDKVGYRQFTLFAIWTIKDIYLDNIGTKEEYSNALDENHTNQTLFINGSKQFYDESTSTYFKNTGDILGNIGSRVDGYANRYYSTNTYYLSPSTGQYFSSLTIWFNDNYLINGTYSNQTRGKLTLTFEWNKVNRKLTITSARLEIGGMSGGEFVATYTATNDDTEGLRPVISDNGQSVTISGEASYCFVSEIEISVSKYMLVEDVSDKNINTAYKDSEWIDRTVPSWLTGAGLKDVHYLTISVTGQKSNLVFDGTTMGQTFDVDYYRFVRPSDGMQTYIDNEENSTTYGEEVWDSEFVNDWSMYEVYKTTTYRYGEYASTTYSYATNFAFSSWYFYQGHITNYVEYGNYGNADIIYQTHESYLIPQTVQFVWDESESKYVFTQTLSYYLIDSDGNVISSKQDDQDAITAKCLLAYKDEEDVTYVWNEAESKYVFTQTLTYYLKDSGNIISSKQDNQDEITGWLLVNNDGSYQCSQGQYALYDFIGKWKDPVTYYWCTWLDDYGQLTGGYVTGNDLSECKEFNEKLGAGYEVLDSGRLYRYNDAHEKVELDSVTLHSYKYNDDYKDYRYDNKAIRGNVSMVAVYVPAQTRKVYYYTWKDSGSTSSGYEERTTTSNRYVLGVKYTASVTNVVEDGKITSGNDYGFIKYWELGTNNQYYRVGFSGFSSFDGSGNPTVTSALAFLMQFVNKDNWDNNKPTGIDICANDEYPTDVGGLVNISYLRLVRIINSLGYGTIGNNNTDVVTLAVNLYKTLLKKTDSYKAYEYLQQSDVVLSFGMGDMSKDINDCYKALKSSMPLFEITVSDEDLLNIATFMTVYQRSCGQGLRLTKEIIQKLINGQDEDVNAWAGDIIDNFTAEQLAVVLDKISMDYFGYVLINPSENIGYWPSGTYLAGWYMIPDTLRQELIKSTGSAVLTFDSDNFVSNGNLECLEIVEEVEDPFGNITYIVKMPNSGVQYEVTRFNVFNKEQLDILSRVETSVYIFAAYNTIKFEIADLEYLKDALGNKVINPNYENGKLVESYKDINGIVYTWDGTGYAYYKVEYLTDDSGNIITVQQKDESDKLLSSIEKDGKTYVWDSDEQRYILKANQGRVEGHLDIDIKYAHKTITKTDGNPYLYQNEDVRYVVLNSDKMLELAEEFKKNNNIPTSLQTIISKYGLNVYESLDGATSDANEGDTIVAFIYNLTSYTVVEGDDGELTETKRFNGEEIIYFATSCCYKDNTGDYLYNLVEKLNEIYDTKSAELYD